MRGLTTCRLAGTPGGECLLLAVLAGSLVGLSTVASAGEEPAAAPTSETTPAASTLAAASNDAQSRALFERLDANQDGHVAADEIAADKERLFNRLVAKADADHDGRLSRDEFVAGLASTRPVPKADDSGAEGRAPQVFDGDAFFHRMDANGDGRVTTDEIPAERRENFSKLLERADANSDSALSRDEFEKVRQYFGDRKPAAGQPAAGPDPARLWQRLMAGDKNGDGKLSADELPERLQLRFRSFGWKPK